MHRTAFSGAEIIFNTFTIPKMITKEKTDRIFIGFAILLSIALLLLAITRACLLPLTHDEAMSFNNYVHKPIFDIIGYVDTYGQPNNHILNTLMMKFCLFIFGNSPLALRLPNLAALLLYIYCCFFLLWPLKVKWLREAGLILLCLNPFLLDFFTLARGYGLCNGLMLLSVLLLFKWWKSPSPQKGIGLFAASSFMVLSNFMSLHLYFTMTICYVVLVLKREKTDSARKYFRVLSIPLFSAAVLGGLLYEPFRCIIKWKTTWGGHTGYWQDCILPLIGETSYDAPYSDSMISVLSFIVIVLFTSMALFSLLAVIRKNNPLVPVLFLLLCGPILFMQVQHWLFGTEFPTPRTIQYIYPLFILVFIFCLDSVKTRLNLFLIYGAAGLLLTHLILVFNLRSALEWRYDASNQMVINDVKNNATKKPVRLGITWIFEPGMNYELNRIESKLIEPLTREGVAGEYDFYYVVATDTAQLTSRGKKIIARYPQSNTFLLR